MSMRDQLSRFSGPAVTTRIWRLFALAAVAVTLLIAALLVGLARTQTTRAEIARTASIERNLGELGEALLDAETGQRGFMVTNDESYLEPYASGIVTANHDLRALRGLMTDAVEQATYRTMAPTVAAKLDELARTIELTKAGRRDEALRIVVAGDGKRFMNEFRAQRLSTIVRERRLLEEQRLQANGRFFHLKLISLLGGAATIAILLLSARRTTDKLRQPIQALVDAMLKIAAGSPDRQLAVAAADEIGAMTTAFNTMVERLAASRAAKEAAVAELQISHDAMRESQQRLQLVTDNVPGLICQLDREFRYQFANQTYAHWFGFDPAWMVGKSYYEVHGEAAFDETVRALELAMSGATVTDERELPILGSFRHCQRIMIPQANEAGEITGLFVVHNDITERRQAELSLRESQNFLSRTGAAAGVGGWELNLLTGKLTWSEETRRLHEVSADYEPTLENGIGFYTAASRETIRRAVEQGVAHATPWDLELELISAKGRHFWARATGMAEVEHGVTVRLTGAIQDVTARRRLQQELAESYELVRVTLDSIGDAVITTDQEGRVRWLNPVAEVMTGWTKTEASSKPLAKVFQILQSESRETALNPVTVCLRDGRTVGLQSHVTLVSRGGTEYGIENSASPIRNSAGTIFGAVLVFRDVTEQRRLSHEMSHRATHDSLTGLINRAEFEVRLARLLANATLEGTCHVLMYVDLDEFKVVNDACGHSAGDQLLRQVSTLLKGSMRGRDTVARLGGDEFGVILEGCGIEQGQFIAAKICEQMESYRFIHDGRRYRIGTSIGVVPVDVRWVNSAAVMQAADSCCYAAKDAGRNRVHLWVESDSALQVRQGEMQWVNRLEAAMDENRFTLYAQRIEPIDGPDGNLHCEVLLRLREPDGSLILPGAFLPAAERFHLAPRLDRWVVRHVFDLLQSDEVFVDRIDTVAINLSGQSLGDRAFHRDLIRMLEDARFSVDKLCFEITETAAITNLGDAKDFIDVVRALGVRIALDDFGAGASSFGYLRTLPVDYLKIDGQFVTRLLDDAIDHAAVRCFCEVAKVIGVKTIAEFVENVEVREELQRLGVDMAQGYLIHRAGPLQQMLPRGTLKPA